MAAELFKERATAYDSCLDMSIGLGRPQLKDWNVVAILNNAHYAVIRVQPGEDLQRLALELLAKWQNRTLGDKLTPTEFLALQ